MRFVGSVRKESSDAARWRPYLLITHSSQLTAQNVLMSNLKTHGSWLI